MLLSGYKNCFKIPELKKRILFTCGIIALCRLVSLIPCPGVNPAGLKDLFSGGQGEGGMLDMLNLFSGGAIEQFAVGALGIMPYISASIILQLMTPVIPQLERLMREGESGQKKYNQYMRYLTLAICIVQGVMYASVMSNPSSIGLKGEAVVLNPGFGFTVMTVITLTAGAMLVMWMGEMITEHGIGNGASLIITVNIVARLPGALQTLWKQFSMGAASSDSDLNLIHILILIVMFFVVTAATVALTLGAYRVPIRYAAKRMQGIGGTATAQTSFLPLRVNYSGVMPIIFAGAIISFPLMLMRYLPQDWGWVVWLEMHLQYGSTGYLLTYGAMILIFSFFWVANQFNPIKIADDLQKNGGYIPGIRPGQATSDFLGKTMDRITLAGAIFLAALAVLPMLLSRSLNIQPNIAQFFGGTSLLIIVGVTLETLQQVENYLVARNYEGFMEKGRLRSRRG
ncbi:MAG: preprotein translocase subunit SecY [Victivallales bacterium]|nr:preprotein translocase subunit SecY [Victivallales bacterium]